MAVELSDFKNQINADDDEDVQKYLDDAIAYVNFYISQNVSKYTDTRTKQFEKIRDRAILEVATTFYLKRDGSPVSGTVNSASLDMIINYGRDFSMQRGVINGK